MYNYPDDIKVDMNALDEELEKQTMLYDHYATMELEAEEEMEKAQRRLDLKMAEMDEKIRRKPSVYGLEEGEPKVTAIKYVIARSKEIQDAEEELSKIRTKWKRAKIRTKAIAEQKKMALTKGTDLFSAGYFQRTLPKNAKEIMDERKEQKSRQKLGESPRMKELIRRRSKE